MFLTRCHGGYLKYNQIQRINLSSRHQWSGYRRFDRQNRLLARGGRYPVNPALCLLWREGCSSGKFCTAPLVLDRFGAPLLRGLLWGSGSFSAVRHVSLRQAASLLVPAGVR